MSLPYIYRLGIFELIMNFWWILTIVLGLSFLFFAAGLLWRNASTRKSRPLPVWLSWMVDLDNPFTRINRAATIVEHLRLQPGMKVADFGCGPGRNTIPIAQAVGENGEVSAIDVQAGMLQQVELKATGLDLRNIECHLLDLGSGELPENHYDRIVMVTVIGEIPDQQAAITQVYRSLKSDGLFSITEVIFDPHFQSRKHIRHLAAAKGFEEVATFGGPLAYTLNFKKRSQQN